MSDGRRVAPLIVAIVAAVYFAAFVRYGLLLEDEGLILLQIARTFRGQFPYLQFHTGYPPGTFYLNAALFRLFGESVIPVRLLLVVVNAATTGLLFALARPWAGSAIAAVVALGWAAHLPVFVGLFCAFNVPYPSWYADAAFLLTQVAFDRHLATGRRGPLFAAGLAAGLTFAFKQNAGALAAVACGLTLALLRAGRDDPDRHLARALLAAAGGFLLAGFTLAIASTEAVFVIGPALLLIVGRLGWAREGGAATGRLAPAVAILALGTVIASLPWLLPFLAVLGVQGLLHEIFLVGTDFDLVYATPYPLPLGLPDTWPLLATVGIAALAIGGIAVHRGRLRVGTAVAMLAVTGAAMVGVIVHFARIPEGLPRAVMLQTQYVGFFAAPLLYGVVGAAWLRRMRRPARALRALEPRLLGVLVFAVCMYPELYPRIDPTHLIIALPSGLVLAAWAAARASDAWAVALGVSRRVPRGVVVAVAAALALIASVPNLSAFVERRDGVLRRRDTVDVASPAAPVHVDAAHASDVRALNALLGYLRARLRPDEGVFGFPGMALVPYLLGHPSVTRHDYWYAGRPDHLEEAEVVRMLETDVPRYAITVNRNIGFFSNSARYYFILRAFVQAHYVPVARFGRYDVLARRELATGPLVVQDFVHDVGDDLIASMAEPLHEPRRAAVAAFLARAGTPDGVAPLARELMPAAASQLLLLRALIEVPDLRAVPFLARVVEDRRDLRVRGQAALALTYVALNAAEHRYLLGRLPTEREPSLADLAGLLDPGLARRWLQSREYRRLVGAFAIWYLAGTRDPASATLLADVYRIETRKPYLRMLAANALVRTGRLAYLCELVACLGDKRHDYQDGIPSMLIEAAVEHPHEVALCLGQGLLDERRRGREVSAWTAGAAGLREVTPALRDALRDSQWRVRMAAIWALGRLSAVEARPDLERLAHDDDPQTRAFASEALARLDPGGSAVR